MPSPPCAFSHSWLAPCECLLQCVVCGVEDKEGGREKCCCPCCLALYIPDCKGGFAGIGFCVPPKITKTEEGFDGAMVGHFVKKAGAPPAAEMER